MTSYTYGLILPFPDESESFTNGFEAGELWARFRSGDAPEAYTAHTANIDLIRSMAVMHGYITTFLPTDYPEWTNVIFDRKPKLRVVNSSAALEVDPATGP